MVATISACAGLHAAALQAARKDPRKRLHDQIAEYRARLHALLGNASPQPFADAFGNQAEVLFNTGKLAASLQNRVRGRRFVETARHQRLRQALAAFDQYSHWAEPGVIHAESFTIALSHCSRMLEQFTAMLKALRLSKLECDAVYDPAIHDKLIAGMSWHSAKPEELAAAPAIVVTVPAKSIHGSALDELGKLLRSGMPVQILIPCNSVLLEETDLGWFAMSQREAFVLQSSITEPEHLKAGLRRMTDKVIPAVAIVSEQESRVPEQSRAFPLYQYDPAGGSSWSECLQLREPDAAMMLTPAHAIFESSEASQHFEVIPDEAWEADQMELGEFLNHTGKDAPHAVPYIWVAPLKNDRRRALVSREMVEFSRERIRNCRLLQDLAGIRATQPATIAAKLEGANESRERVVIEKAQQAGAAAAIHRLVAALTGTAIPIPEKKTELTPRVLPDAPAVPQNDIPRIDSFLCTSCNDCIKINNRMFGYNAEKQAYVADAKAGTFAELVKAAEGCPARCIHPGSPRAGDSTATAAMIARAKKFP